MEIPIKGIESSTRVIADSFKTRNTLQAAMRGGLVCLVDVLDGDAEELRQLDVDEQGLYVIEAHELLTQGWTHVVGRMDYDGRDFTEPSGAEDTARMHYRFAQAHIDERFKTEYDQQKALTHSALLLGQLVLHLTQPRR